MNTKHLAYLPIAAVLALPFLAVPYNAASAQTEEAEILVRIIQGAAQEGLVNLNVQVGNVDVIDDITVDVSENNIALPITIPIAANVNAAVEVCATVLSSGDQVCRTVQNVQQDATNRVTLPLSQAQ